MVLTTISTYADKQGRGAHPGWARLEQDTLLDLRTLKKAVRDLCDLGYLIQTAEGGNQIRKGQANEYALGDLAKVREGIHPVTPLVRSLARSTRADSRRPSERELAAEQARQMAALKAVMDEQGVHPVQARGTSGALEGVHPVTPHQGNSSSPSIIPPPAASGSSTDEHANPNIETWRTLRDDCAAFEAWLQADLGDLDAMEWSTALGMWEKNEHPKAIANTIKAGRSNRWAS